MFFNIGIFGLVIILVIVLIIFGLFKLLEVGWVFGWILIEFKGVVKGFVFDDESVKEK